MLADYLPDFMREVKEISCITRVQDYEFDCISRAVDRCLNNSFAQSADSQGLEHWERLFGVVVNPGSGVCERRREILSRLSDRLPYTYNTLDAVFIELFGDGGRPRHCFCVDYENFHVKVLLNLALEDRVSVIEGLVRRRIPANMSFEIIWVFMTYADLEKYTYEKLGNYTYEQIRRGEFN
jgi:hypothetical protein